MNDITSAIGLMRREVRDTHAVVSRLDHQTRKLFEPSARPRWRGNTFPAITNSAGWSR